MLADRLAHRETHRHDQRNTSRLSRGRSASCFLSLRCSFLGPSLLGPVELPSAAEHFLFYCCYDISLEQLAGSSPFFGISGAVQKVAEDGTVYAILYRLTNN